MHLQTTAVRRLVGHKARRRLASRLVLPLTICFSGSFILLPVAQGISEPLRTPKPAGHIRKLSPDEMRAITGAQLHTLSAGAAGGGTYSWEGSVPVAPIGSMNTANGNLLTAIPIVSWTARGGMPVDLTLYHNSEGSHNSELGQHWTHSYDVYLIVTAAGGGGGGGGLLVSSDGGVKSESGHKAKKTAHDIFDPSVIKRHGKYAALCATGDVTIHWGDDLAYTFTRNINGSYTAPTGIYDTLVANTTLGVITSYDLTRKNQVKYHFTNPNGTGWYLSTITDLNSNVITVNHNTSDFVTSVVDSTSRTISFTYTGGVITSITDPLSRSWSISYTSGKLTQITYPTVSGNSYNCQFAYNANYDITTYTDKRGYTWTFSYYSDHSLDWSKTPPLNQTTYSYSSGQTTVSDPNSHTVKHSYTSGLLTGVVDGLNNTESYSYTSNCPLCANMI